MLLRRIARPLLSAAFVAEGVEVFRDPKPVAEKLAPALDVILGERQYITAVPNATVVPNAAETSDTVPPVDEPDRASQATARVVAGTQIAAAALLALGKAPRSAAATLVATTAVNMSQYDFWTESDPQRKRHQRTQFLAGITKLGGVLIAAADTEGQPSLAWRGRRAARRAKQHAGELAESAKDLVVAHEPSVGERGQRAARKAQEGAAVLADTARERGSELVETVRDQAPHYTEAARDRAHKAAEIARAKADIARAKAHEIKAQIS